MSRSTKTNQKIRGHYPAVKYIYIYIHTSSSVREMLLHFTHLSSDAIGDDESVDTIVGSGNEGVAAFNDAPDNDSDDVVDEQKNDDDDR